MADLREMTLSNNFADYIFPYNRTFTENLPDSASGSYDYQVLNSRYLMIHLDNSVYPIESLINIGYSSIPALFAPTSIVSPENAGILKVQSSPVLNLRGRGVMIGFLDTGINYTHPAFLDDTGRTRILRLWDQTVQTGTPPKGFVYGSEYTKEDIQEALAADDPYKTVPSLDRHGHGTLIAGIACGREDIPKGFTGAAPESYLAVVKLKEAKPYLRDYFLVHTKEPVFQETDILLALKYLQETAASLSLPLVICIALGTNQGSHNGNTPLDISLMLLRAVPGICLVTAGGNEAGRAHHYAGRISDENSYAEAELRIPQDMRGFSMELWGQPPEIFSVGAISPLGEVVERIPARLGQHQTIRFVLENTVLRISYELVETISGEQVILLRFSEPTPGIWRIRVYCSNYVSGHFHLWLPITGLSDPEAAFLQPDPFHTIVIPGNNTGVITTSTYDAYTDALYPYSSRGFTPTGIVTPDICAPGVNVTGPDLRKGYIAGTGSGTGAALTAGVCAMILEWGMSRNPPRNYYTNEVRTFLIRGAVRDPENSYPGRELGYGRLDAYRVFSAFLNP